MLSFQLCLFMIMHRSSLSSVCFLLQKKILVKKNSLCFGGFNPYIISNKEAHMKLQYAKQDSISSH